MGQNAEYQNHGMYRESVCTDSPHFLLLGEDHPPNIQWNIFPLLSKAVRLYLLLTLGFWILKTKNVFIPPSNRRRGANGWINMYKDYPGKITMLPVSEAISSTFVCGQCAWLPFGTLKLASWDEPCQKRRPENTHQVNAWLMFWQRLSNRSGDFHGQSVFIMISSVMETVTQKKKK